MQYFNTILLTHWYWPGLYGHNLWQFIEWSYVGLDTFTISLLSLMKLGTFMTYIVCVFNEVTPRAHVKWINEFSLQTEKAASAADEIHFLGDFNINLLCNETQSRTWSHFLDAFDFSQLVKEPTRVTYPSDGTFGYPYRSCLYKPTW